MHWTCPVSLNTEHLLRAAATLEQALIAFGKPTDPAGVEYDLFRNAAIQSFELCLKTAGKLLHSYLAHVRVPAVALQHVLDAAG